MAFSSSNIILCAALLTLFKTKTIIALLAYPIIVF